MSARALVVVGVLLFGSGVHAEDRPPATTSPTTPASRRFPHAVRVADLLNRQVLQPLESQPTLGWVRDIVRRPNGAIDVVVNYAATIRFITRPIAVPLDAMVLVGQYMEIVDWTPEQLSTFATFTGADATSLPPDSIVHVGLAGPSH